MKPSERKGLLNPAFVYVPSHQTDIRETFNRIREKAAATPAGKRCIALAPKQATHAAGAK